MYIVTYIVVIQTFLCLLHLSLRVWMHVLEQPAVDVLQIAIYIFDGHLIVILVPHFPHVFLHSGHLYIMFSNIESGLKSL